MVNQAFTMWLGVDFGTCYSSAAVTLDGHPKPVKFGHNLTSLPSSVFLKPDGTLVVGTTAENNMKLAPECYKREFKRDLGGNIPCYLNGQAFSPEQLIVAVLARLKTAAEEQFLDGRRFTHGLLTIPADYEDHRRNLLRDAASNAGFENVELLAEPVAAASYYMWQTGSQNKWKEDDIILVYDLGGGTFDAALIQKRNFAFELMVQPVSRSIGGIDFDRCIFGYLKDNVPDLQEIITGNDEKGILARLTLVDSCRKIKHRLSEESVVEEVIYIGGKKTHFSMERTMFEELVEDLIDQTISACEELMLQASIKSESVKGILLVGGSTRIPLIKRVIQEKLKCHVFNVDEPELAVALGAAIHADQAHEEGAAPSDAVMSQYKTAVRVAWSDGELNDAEIKHLEGLELSLGLRARDTEAAEKEIMGIGRGELAEQKALELFKIGRFRSAFPGFERAAKIGYPLSQYYLGVLYESGRGIDRDPEEAEKWYLRSASQGYVEAQFRLGSLYYDQGQDPDIVSRAEKYFRMAAEQDHSIAQNDLAQMYHEGLKVKQDLEIAEKWYTRAADQGLALAIYNLGVLYEEKGNTSRYLKQAVKWYRKAAEKNNPDAQFELGLMYENGLGINQDYKEALKWYLEASKYEHWKAQSRIGEFYKMGKGVQISRTEARKWLDMARKTRESQEKNS